MLLNEYLKEIKRTVPYNLNHKDKILNFTLGIVGETNELISEIKKSLGYYSKELILKNSSVKKEFGDCFWYVLNLYELIHDKNIELNIDLEGKIYDLCDELTIDSCILAEKVKKFIYHGEYIQAINIESVLATLYTLLHACGMNIEEIFDINIEKLRKRYPKEFSIEDSINRKE